MEAQVAHAEVGWTPRRELCLPNELLHKIILETLRDAVHTVCISAEDTTWEKGMMDTLHEVSDVFKAISNEIALKAFDIPKFNRGDDIRYVVFTFLPPLSFQSSSQLISFVFVFVYVKL